MNYATELVLKTASTSIELSDLKQVKKIEERKIRQEIVKEYESLVKDLVKEIHVLGSRFMEFRTNTVNQVLDIISESRREQLEKMTENNNIPSIIRDQVAISIEFQDKLKEVEDENHELNMTVTISNFWVYCEACQDTINV